MNRSSNKGAVADLMTLAVPAWAQTGFFVGAQVTGVSLK